VGIELVVTRKKKKNNKSSIKIRSVGPCKTQGKKERKSSQNEIGVRSRVHNYILRTEACRKESFTGGVQGKKIRSPVERESTEGETNPAERKGPGLTSTKSVCVCTMRKRHF